jgi:hypothetical protein
MTIIEQRRECENGSRGWAAIIVCISENVFFKNINLPQAYAASFIRSFLKKPSSN